MEPVTSMSTSNAVDSDFDPFDVNEDNPFDVDVSLFAVLSVGVK